MKKLSYILLLLIISNTSSAEENYLYKYRLDGVKANITYGGEENSDDDKNEESDSDVFRFRHVEHETQGWADIVVAKINNEITVRNEIDYRNATLDSGYDAYYSNVVSWRCDEQEYGPSIVPEVDYDCNVDYSGTSSYILIEKPKELDNIPQFLIRNHDDEYGRYGNGTWIELHGGPSAYVEVDSTSLQNALSYETPNTNNHNLLSGAEYTLMPGDWVMATDPTTNFRN